MDINKTKTIGDTEVTSKVWKHRIYFSAGRHGQACWDAEAQEWASVKNEFGARFKAEIKVAFEL